MGGNIYWDESEIQEVVRSRSCAQGIEYYIIWKNGERSTWELRDSFTSKNFFDEFDRKALKKATDWAPIFNAEQKFIKSQYARPKRTRSLKSRVQNPSEPDGIKGCVDINGTKFAIVTFEGNSSQLIRWDIVKNDYPELSDKFLESRCLKDIFN
uniref:Chromo domain-containing protein n=1 Tax=Panagrolaimus superbus TaxID=310955 RepID=A0A914XUJ6_9BILA